MVNENWDPNSRIYKYVDDTTIAVAYKPGETPPIQEILTRISEWTERNNIKINPKKCAVLSYKFNKQPVTLPSVNIDGVQLKQENSVTLLGAKLSNDLKWSLNTENIITKCSAKLYMLSKLKAFQVSRQDLVKIWTSFITPTTEYVAPLWHSSLTVEETEKLKDCKKGPHGQSWDHPGYENAPKF